MVAWIACDFMARLECQNTTPTFVGDYKPQYKESLLKL